MPDSYGICHQSCGACHEVYPPLLCKHKWRKTYDTYIIKLNLSEKSLSKGAKMAENHEIMRFFVDMVDI